MWAMPYSPSHIAGDEVADIARTAAPGKSDQTSCKTTYTYLPDYSRIDLCRDHEEEMRMSKSNGIG
jgi:hypothetical protein